MALENITKVFITGEVYGDSKCKQAVEYRYTGQTGYAIVCEPGDSGGSMQSCWGIKPERLEQITEEHVREMRD